jgi:hypothetical protein
MKKFITGTEVKDNNKVVTAKVIKVTEKMVRVEVDGVEYIRKPQPVGNLGYSIKVGDYTFLSMYVVETTTDTEEPNTPVEETATDTEVQEKPLELGMHKLVPTVYEKQGTKLLKCNFMYNMSEKQALEELMPYIKNNSFLTNTSTEHNGQKYFLGLSSCEVATTLIMDVVSHRDDVNELSDGCYLFIVYSDSLRQLYDIAMEYIDNLKRFNNVDHWFGEQRHHFWAGSRYGDWMCLEYRYGLGIATFALETDRGNLYKRVYTVKVEYVSDECIEKAVFYDENSKPHVILSSMADSCKPYKYWDSYKSYIECQYETLRTYEIVTSTKEYEVPAYQRLVTEYGHVKYMTSVWDIKEFETQGNEVDSSSTDILELYVKNTEMLTNDDYNELTSKLIDIDILDKYNITYGGYFSKWLDSVGCHKLIKNKKFLDVVFSNPEYYNKLKSTGYIEVTKVINISNGEVVYLNRCFAFSNVPNAILPCEKLKKMVELEVDYTSTLAFALLGHDRDKETYKLMLNTLYGKLLVRPQNIINFNPNIPIYEYIDSLNLNEKEKDMYYKALEEMDRKEEQRMIDDNSKHITTLEEHEKMDKAFIDSLELDDEKEVINMVGVDVNSKYPDNTVGVDVNSNYPTTEQRQVLNNLYSRDEKVQNFN